MWFLVSKQMGRSLIQLSHVGPGFAGDFAVLLKAGMSVKQAIVYNLLSALMAYVGMVIGTAVGQYAHNVTTWIFAVTAGMFLYVALVDMVRSAGSPSPRGADITVGRHWIIIHSKESVLSDCLYV